MKKIFALIILLTMTSGCAEFAAVTSGISLVLDVNREIQEDREKKKAEKRRYKGPLTKQKI